MGASGLVKAVVDGLSEGVVVRDADNNLLLCNAAAEAIIGLSAEELVDFPSLPDGWTALDADGEPMPPGENSALWVLRTGEPVRGRVTGLQRPDGTILWISVNAVGLPPSGPDDRGTVAVSFMDITEARRSEAERHRLEQRLQRVNALRLTVGTAMVQATDPDDLVRRICEIAVRDAGFLLAWFGVPDRQSGVIRPIASSGSDAYLEDLVITLGEADPRSHGPTGTAAREGQAVVNRDTATEPRMGPWREEALRHGFGASAAFPLDWNGERCVFMVYAAEPDFFNDEETRMLQQFVDDLTLGLRETAGRRFLSTLTDHMGEGLIALDQSHRLTYVNGAALELLGWSRADLEGQHVHELLHPRELRPIPCTPGTCGLMHGATTGTAIPIEDTFTRQDGTALPVSYTATAVDDATAGTIIVFSDDTQRRREAERVRAELARLSWAARIKDALAEDRFCLYAQPIVEAATGRTVQHEVLIRMRGEHGHLILPGAFLPTAEACGLMADVDRWVIARVAEHAAAGHAIEFNLSAASLADPAMLAYIEDALGGLTARAHIVCEVTETALVKDPAAAEVFLARLQALGIDVALDDFGSGYSTFTYLKSFPATYLKIDREFITDLADHPASRHVVEAVVRLAKALGKLTVAEGVEDPAALPVLADLGVDFAQGFGLGRPAPVEQVFGPRG
jgi:PAS domain S-box-containing protein